MQQAEELSPSALIPTGMDFWSNRTNLPENRESLCPLGGAYTLLLRRFQHWPASTARFRSLRTALQTVVVGCSSRRASATSNAATCRMPNATASACDSLEDVGSRPKRAREALCFTLHVCRAEVAVLVRFAEAWPTIAGGVTHYSKLKPSSSSPFLLLLLFITVFDSPFSCPYPCYSAQAALTITLRSLPCLVSEGPSLTISTEALLLEATGFFDAVLATLSAALFGTVSACAIFGSAWAPRALTDLACNSP